MVKAGTIVGFIVVVAAGWVLKKASVSGCSFGFVGFGRVR